MITNIGRELGETCVEGGWAFPRPEQLALSTERVLREKCKTGYRAPFLLALAERVAAGTLPVEAWRSSKLSTPMLYEAVCSVKGIGPYAAGNIVRLLGRYDYLALDSWVRTKFAELHTRGRKVKDSTIEKAYAQYGEWRGLFFWLEMTHDWHHEKFAD
jgi:N-glycosylase/DNA lyase